MSLEEILNKLSEAESKNEGESSPVLRLSKAGECRMRIVLGALFPHLGKPPQDWSGIARMGHLIHQAEREAIKRAGLDLRDEERPVLLEVGGERIWGHIDGLLYNGEMRLLEIKSMGGSFFKRSLKEFFLPHLYQIHAYMKALRGEGLNVEKALYWTVNKETGERNVTEIEYSPFVGEKVEMRFASVLEVLSSPPSTPEELPQELADYARNKSLSWLCNRCHLAEVCPAGAVDKSG